MIGYMLIQELKNLMPSRNVTALLTQVQVDPRSGVCQSDQVYRPRLRRG
jgi:carbamate kinase